MVPSRAAARRRIPSRPLTWETSAPPLPSSVISANSIVSFLGLGLSLPYERRGRVGVLRKGLHGHGEPYGDGHQPGLAAVGQIAFDPAEFRTVRQQDVCACPGEFGDACGQLFRGCRCQHCHTAPRVYPGERWQADGRRRRQQQELRRTDRQCGGPAVDADTEQWHAWRIRRGEGPPPYGDAKDEEQVAQAQQGEHARGQAGGHLGHEPREVAARGARARLHRSARQRPGASAVALRQPGTDWNYSNTGYVVLGMIVDKATGRRWQEVAGRILKPLGMHHTCGGSYWSHEGGEADYVTLNGATDDGGRTVTVSMSTSFNAPDETIRQQKAASDLVDRALCDTPGNGQGH
ncbi:serine hydrolase [Streptomyces lavendulae]|uniref:serine hydrolase n=1 Tax=Streptomyces lavendulae TaxID=1914 RepID=UPI0036EC1A5F